MARLLDRIESIGHGERIALVAIVATPLALYADYRAGSAFVDDTINYRSIGESGGRVVSYHQVLGWTQVVWLAAGIGMAACRGTRLAFRSLPAVLLVVLLILILSVTAVRGGIDRTTVVDLGATLVPLIAMAVVLTSPLVSQDVRRLLVTIFIAECAVIVVLSLSKKVITGHSGARLEAFAFGSAPELGLVLAAVVLLAFASVGPVLLRTALLVVTSGGLLLTQTRGAILAVVIGGIVLGLLVPGVRRWVGLGVTSLVVVFALMTSRSLSFSDLSTTYRRENLAHHWALFKREPFLGYGVNASGIDSFRAAHSVFLEVANAAGIFAATLFALVWLAPIFSRLRRRRLERPAAVAIAVVAAVFVGWSTTGSTVLIYNPPTNLLPLVLAVGLLKPPTLGRRRA